MIKQAHVFIKGFVQGVGFRQFVKHAAKKRGVTGWVKNMSDGRVEAILQGEKNSVEETLRFCSKGPMLASVEELDVVWEEQEQLFDTFDVKNF